MLDLHRFDAIIFDMDGTLIDSMGNHLLAWQAVCGDFGIPYDHDYMYSLGGVPTRKTVEILNQKYAMEHDVDAVAKGKRDHWVAMQQTPPLIDETMAVFRHYRPHKPIGIGTGAERPHAEKLLHHHQLLDQLDSLVTASDVTNGKPHPETYLAVAQQLGVEPANCVVFEDTQIGRQAALDAGMECILVLNGIIQR